MRTALLTGASGLVGRATATALVAAGWRVIALGRNAPPVAGVEWRCLNLAAERVPNDLVDIAEAVVHLAAAVPHAAEYPDTDASAALTEAMDYAVLAAARARGVPVVYASGCALYDRNDPAWKTEEARVVAVSPYFRAKLRGENLFLNALPGTIVMRVSAPFGAGLRRGLVLARFAEAARAGQTIQVWGTGSREQDFVHTGDIADFIVAALAAPRAGVWNVAAGRPITMLDLARLCVAAAGRGAVERCAQPDPAEGQTARYCIAAAQRDFGWQPRRTLRDWLAHYRLEDLQ